jgi:succinate dehydrogenase/fumarate reductase-like Fe-S protein
MRRIEEEEEVDKKKKKHSKCIAWTLNVAACRFLRTVSNFMGCFVNTMFCTVLNQVSGSPVGTSRR